MLLDVQLPDSDGCAVASRLKAREQTRDVPVIALTAHAMRADRQRCLAAGCKDYVTKPIDFDELLKEIRKALGGT